MVFSYTGNIKSEIASVHQLMDTLMQALRKRLSEDDLFDLRLILSELMINSCEHGNQNDCRKMVSVDLLITPELIDVTVWDEGRGFQYTQNTAFRNMSCSGRGLRLVEALCDEIQIQNTMVHCRKRRLSI